MTDLLCKLFIRDRDHVSSPASRRAYGVMVSIVGIVINTLLAAGKFTVGFLVGSISIQADGINNLSDAGSQVVSLISFKIAAKPPDRDHPFGHARIEYVASMIVSFFILLIGWELLSESVRKIFSPVAATRFSWVSVAVLGVSVIAKLWLYFFNKKIAARICSPVMRATAADSLSDAGATAAVLIATLVLRFTGFDPDAYMGVAVAVLIMIAGIKILNDTKNSILGEGPSDETLDAIRDVTSRHEGVLGLHDVIVHNYGPGRVMASLHVEFDGEADIFASHDTADLIERELREEYHIEATVHIDPIATSDPRVTTYRDMVKEIVTGIDSRLTIHDFRMVTGESHTNLIFDITTPFEVSLSDDELRREVTERIQARDPKLFAVMLIDRG